MAHRPVMKVMTVSENMVGTSVGKTTFQRTLKGSMESEMFREGTVTDEDGNTISAVDQDCTILRIIDLHDFGIRHEESFVIGKNMQTQK